MGRGELSPPLGACSGGGVVVLNSQMSWAPAEGASWPGLLLEVYGRGVGVCSRCIGPGNMVHTGVVPEECWRSRDRAPPACSGMGIH